MEVAFGAVGAVSLGLQLLGTVKKARKLLQNIHDAPEWISDLVNDLHQFQITLTQADHLITRQRSCPDIGESIECLESALWRCETTIESMEEMTDRLSGFFDKNSKTRKIWASLKAVVKKEKVEACGKQVRERTADLHLAVSLSSNHLVQMQQMELGSIRSEMLLLIAKESCNQSSSDLMKNEPSQRSSVAIAVKPRSTLQCKQFYNLVYRGILGQIQVHRRCRSIAEDRRKQANYTDEEGSVRIAPIFMRRIYEYSYRQGYGHVSRSLTSFDVLPYGSPIFDICASGDLLGFQNALCNHEASPFVMNKYGQTLLHFAAQGSSAEICSLLIQYGVDPNREDDWGGTALSASAYRNSMDVVRLLGQMHDEVTLTEIEAFAYCWRGPSEIAEFLQTHEGVCDILDYGHGAERVDPFLGMALRRFAQNPGDQDWGSFLKSRLNRHGDLHATSILEKIFKDTLDPFEADVVGKSWLKLLSEAGYDIAAYLEREMSFGPNRDFTHAWEVGYRRRLTFQLGGTPSISWDWWVDPESHAGLVRYEFRHMNVRNEAFKPLYHGWHRRWPFAYPDWSTACRPILRRKGSNSAYLSWRAKHEKAQKRYGNRAQKKRIKAMRVEGSYRRSRIPGSWIE